MCVCVQLPQGINICDFSHFFLGMASGAAKSGIQKLFVSNLPWTVSHRELRNYFAEFGRVITANVIFDKKTGISKRYGFVTVPKSVLPNLENRQKHTLEHSTIVIQRTE